VGYGGNELESFLSAHELSALIVIEQAASESDLDQSEVEHLISRRLVERDTRGHGTPELKITNDGNTVLTRIFAFDWRSGS
jgi:hypothetical protein